MSKQLRKPITEELHRRHGYKVMEVKIKPVHIANALMRTEHQCAGRMPVLEQLFEATLPKNSIDKRVAAVQSMLESHRDRWGALGQAQDIKSSPLMTKVLPLIRTLLGADGAAFGSSPQLSSFSSPTALTVTGDPSDDGAGAFIHALWGGREGADRLPILDLLAELTSPDKAPEKMDDLSALLVPLVDSTRPRAAHAFSAQDMSEGFSPIEQELRAAARSLCAYETKLRPNPISSLQRIVVLAALSVFRHGATRAQERAGGPQRLLLLDASSDHYSDIARASVGLVLTASKKVKGEVPFAGSESVSGADTLDPARVFELLNSAGEADGPQALAEEAQDESSAKSNAAPNADPNAGLRRSSKSAKAERSLASPAGEQAATGLLEVSLGQETNTKQPVAWAPGKQSNGFFLILGASGSGKTETLKVLGKGIADYGVPVLVLDFHGDVQFPGLRSVLLSSGTSSTTGVNPMELDSQSAEETGLYDQRKVIRDMIRNAVPALGHRQGAILRDAIEEAYVRAGFNDSDPATWRNTPPTFADVQEILADWADDDSRKSQRTSIEGCLAAVQEIFEHPIFQRREHVSVDEILSRSMRLDLSKLTEEVRYITAETLLRKIFRVLRLMGPIPVQPVDDRQRFRLFVVIDEAKILSTGGGDPDSPERILNQLFTEARKFGLGMVLASQMSDHFGSEVKANAASWLVLKPMDVKEAKKNAPNVHMEPDALTSLRGKGDGYLRDRSSPKARRIQVQALPSNDQKK